MRRKGHRTILLAFLMITFALGVTTVYTFYTYLTVFTAVRALDILVSEFGLEWSSETLLMTKTIVSVKNPSLVEFTASGIEQRVTFNGQYISSTHEAEPQPATNKPLLLQPQSTTNMTITMIVPEDKMELLSDSSQQIWRALVYVFLEGPLVGKFSVTASGQITTSG